MRGGDDNPSPDHRPSVVMLTSRSRPKQSRPDRSATTPRQHCSSGRHSRCRGVRTVHIHVVGQGSRAWTDYLRFHALPRDDADAGDRYQSAKRELARTFARDRPGYTKAKGAVVEELLASDDRSLTPHPR